MRTKVLLVEDSADMRKALNSFLNQRGFSSTAVDSAEKGIDAIDEQDFDIALIDINLGGKSGFELIEYIRIQGNNMPLIAMTARDNISDKVRGFELGLTDYITKPFELAELIARMNAHIKQYGEKNYLSKIQTPNYKLNPLTWEFCDKGKLVELTKTEFRLMHLLMLNNHSVVNNNDLIEFIWGSDHESINPPIRIHIANLRKKINDTDFVIIKTIPAIGYKLNDPLNEN